MSVRAKFRVYNITPPVTTQVWVGQEDGQPVYEDKEIVNISMAPVTSSVDNEENSKFFASTPSGNINLGTVNMDAANEFVIGQDYYLDFTAVGNEDENVVS